MVYPKKKTVMGEDSPQNQGNERLPLSSLQGTSPRSETPRKLSGSKSLHQLRQEMLECRRKLAALKESDIETYFHTPVDPVDDHAPGYFDVIKEPSDFGTIEAKLDRSEIGPEEFDRLVILVFTNAIKYNPSQNHEVHRAARRLLNYFLQGCPRGDVCISLRNETYKEAIKKGALNVHAGKSCLEDKSLNLFRHFKSYGGKWLKLGNDRKTHYQASDVEARKKIRYDLRAGVCYLKKVANGKVKDKTNKDSIGQAQKRKIVDGDHAAKRGKSSISQKENRNQQLYGRGRDGFAQQQQPGMHSPYQPSKLSGKTQVPAKEEEDDDDDDIEAYDMIDLFSSDSEDEDSIAPAIHRREQHKSKSYTTVSARAASSGLNRNPTHSTLSTYNTHISDSTRRPFFHYYDIVAEKLSSAQQCNNSEAKELYGHLREWFIGKTNEEGFNISRFDHALIEHCIMSFDTASRRLTTAKSQGQQGSMSVYKLELKCIIDECKKNFPIISIKDESSIKREDDQYF